MVSGATVKIICTFHTWERDIYLRRISGSWIMKFSFSNCLFFYFANITYLYFTITLFQLQKENGLKLFKAPNHFLYNFIIYCFTSCNLSL